ncbi:MAG: protein kinase, partial [bacterium]|nr:protein kinase [bacterium]
GALFAGRYELVDPLGAGGAGVVWRAWDHREGRYVAAKVLRKVDATSLIRFVREQSYRIDHPHVLTPLGWAADDDQVLLSMPLVTGGSLATLLGDYGALPPQWVARILDQVLAALEAIHGAGLVHRDVTPANVLLDATGMAEPRVRLGDFGVAVAVNEPRLTEHAVVLGTPGYVAPETLTGDSDPLPAADLYAAGMLGWELLTGSRPERGGAPGTASSGAAGPLAAVLEALTSPRPTDRPESASHARRLLGEAGLLEAPLGEEIEVFTQLPELPEAWGEDGPITTTTAQPQPDGPRAETGVPGSAPRGDSARDAVPPLEGQPSQRRASPVVPVLAIIAGLGLLVAALWMLF